MSRAPIYLDHNASTPCDPRALAAMLPHFGADFANPSSAAHAPGRRASAALEEAREQVAALLGAAPGDVLFTSGATESNNLALYGVARAAQAAGDARRRILTLPTEHKAVLEPLADLGRQGFDVEHVPVDRWGVLDLGALGAMLTPQTLLVSVQAANSETGTLQPLPLVSALVRRAGAVLHCDATQAVGRVPLAWDGIDLLSLSSHKLYGPKGAGALLARRTLRRGRLYPLQRGGSHEGGLRAGTPNVPAIVGFGVACELIAQEGPVEGERLRGLRDTFEAGLRAALPGVRFNGHPQERLPNTSSVTVPGLEADALLANLPGLALSLGSACNAGAVEPSYVLTAMGLSREDADATFRVSLGRPSTAEEVQEATQQIAAAAAHLRERLVP